MPITSPPTSPADALGASWRTDPRGRVRHGASAVLMALVPLVAVWAAVRGAPWDVDVLLGALLACWVLAGASRRSQRRLVEALHRQAAHDPVTGLANRTRLAAALDDALAGPGPVAVLVLDLDRFKEVNDTLGHSAGDHVLRLVAARAERALAGRGLLARLGGDEFAVLLPSCDEASAGGVAEAVHRAVGVPTRVLGVAVSTGLSAGAAVHAGGLPDAARRAVAADELVRRADVAMYHAKSTGTGVALYDPAHDEHTLERLAVTADFARALEADDQVVVHLQPTVSVTTGQLVGVEALARWQHPVRGLLHPATFLDVATAPEHAQAFTRRVLDGALAQCAAWLRQGLEVPVSVNVTVHCLLRASFGQDLLDVLAHHGVPPRLLCLEVTEHALVADPVVVAEVLGALRRHGVRTSVDDFGTGFSSLSYLRRLPVDELKLDRSFARGLFPSGPQGAVDDVVVAAVVDLGHRLGLHVVAEGVEHVHELEVLAQLGCDSVQGHLHGPAVPAAQLPVALLATARRTTPSPVQR